MASQQPIFRTVEVGTGQPITLGEPLSSDVKALMNPAGPNSWQMKDGKFGHAASIVVELAADGTVLNMQFGYDPGTDYDALVERYTEDLGPPEQSDGQSTLWEDSRTSFEVTDHGNVGSVLTDLVAAQG